MINIMPMGCRWGLGGRAVVRSWASILFIKSELHCGRFAPLHNPQMNVRLATQVLSESVSRVLREYYPAWTYSTSELCHNVNRFFDCLNARNQFECVKNRNEICAPYWVSNDTRLNWLQNDFLVYLQKWKESIEARPGMA